jgi:branched-chain amino acid transport system permease protein
MAFTISGAVAGIAGGLFVHLSQSFDISSYGPAQSLNVFTAGVVGGLGSLFGGVLGAVYLRGTDWFITEPAWQFLSSAVGVLLVLLILPGGLASLVIKLRDRLVGYFVGREHQPAAGPAPDGVAEQAAVAEAAPPPADLGEADPVSVERSNQ